ncbi:MAG: hypothetical protein AAF721_41945 [Myxococcota bacterium]
MSLDGTDTSGNDGDSTSGNGTGSGPGSGPGSGSESGPGPDTGTDSGGANTTTSTGDSTGGSAGIEDCDTLCGPYEACDESVYLTCLFNCEDLVPPLAAHDEGCGDAAAAYFECRFTLSCEEAIAAQTEELDPVPCAGLLDTYVTTCVASAPARCDGYCDSLLACFELEPTPENTDACALECVLIEGTIVQANTAACSDAADALFTCLPGPDACQDMELIGCESESDTLSLACGLNR